MVEIDLDELEHRLGLALGTTDLEARRELLAADMAELIAETRKLRTARGDLFVALSEATDCLDQLQTEGVAIAMPWLSALIRTERNHAPPNSASLLSEGLDISGLRDTVRP